MNIAVHRILLSLHSGTLSPVCYPDNPDLIIGSNNGILGNYPPIPRYDHFKRVYTLFKQYLFDRGWSVIENPDIFFRKDKSHTLPCRFACRFHKHPSHHRVKFLYSIFLKMDNEFITSSTHLVWWINSNNFKSVQGEKYHDCSQ
jgi:hypothetical protein